MAAMRLDDGYSGTIAAMGRSQTNVTFDAVI